MLSAKRDIEKADESGCFAGEAFRKVLHTDRETGPDRPGPELNNIKERSAADAVWKERKVENTMKQFCRAANTEVQMKKILSGSYYIVSLLGVLFVVGSFLFATNETHFRKGRSQDISRSRPRALHR